MADAPQKFELVDNPSIGEVYANKLVATSFDGGAVTVTLGTTRFLPEHGGTPKAKKQVATVHVTTRIALSPNAAVELASALGAILKNLSQLKQQQASKAGEEPSS